MNIEIFIGIQSQTCSQQEYSHMENGGELSPPQPSRSRTTTKSETGTLDVPPHRIAVTSSNDRLERVRQRRGTFFSTAGASPLQHKVLTASLKGMAVAAFSGLSDHSEAVAISAEMAENSIGSLSPRSKSSEPQKLSGMSGPHRNSVIRSSRFTQDTSDSFYRHADIEAIAKSLDPTMKVPDSNSDFLAMVNKQVKKSTAKLHKAKKAQDDLRFEMSSVTLEVRDSPYNEVSKARFMNENDSKRMAEHAAAKKNIVSPIRAIMDDGISKTKGNIEDVFSFLESEEHKVVQRSHKKRNALQAKMDSLCSELSVHEAEARVIRREINRHPAGFEKNQLKARLRNTESNIVVTKVDIEDVKAKLFVLQSSALKESVDKMRASQGMPSDETGEAAKTAVENSSVDDANDDEVKTEIDEEEGRENEETLVEEANESAHGDDDGSQNQLDTSNGDKSPSKNLTVSQRRAREQATMFCRGIVLGGVDAAVNIAFMRHVNCVMRKSSKGAAADELFISTQDESQIQQMLSYIEGEMQQVKGLQGGLLKEFEEYQANMDELNLHDSLDTMKDAMRTTLDSFMLASRAKVLRERKKLKGNLRDMNKKARFKREERGAETPMSAYCPIRTLPAVSPVGEPFLPNIVQKHKPTNDSPSRAAKKLRRPKQELFDKQNEIKEMDEEAEEIEHLEDEIERLKSEIRACKKSKKKVASIEMTTRTFGENDSALDTLIRSMKDDIWLMKNRIDTIRRKHTNGVVYRHVPEPESRKFRESVDPYHIIPPHPTEEISPPSTPPPEAKPEKPAKKCMKSRASNLSRNISEWSIQVSTPPDTSRQERKSKPRNKLARRRSTLENLIRRTVEEEK